MTRGSGQLSVHKQAIGAVSTSARAESSTRGAGVP